MGLYYHDYCQDCEWYGQDCQPGEDTLYDESNEPCKSYNPRKSGLEY